MPDPVAAPAPDKAPEPEVAAPAEINPAEHYVIHASVANQLAEYLLERPWREVNHIMRALEGARTLDEYLG